MGVVNVECFVVVVGVDVVSRVGIEADVGSGNLGMHLDRMASASAVAVSVGCF